MGSRTTFTIIVLSVCFVPPIVTAENQSLPKDRISQILLNTKMSERDNSQVATNSAEAADVNSIQYKIGFKDGYQKAVKDLKSSMQNEKTNTSVGPIGGGNYQAQSFSLKSNELVKLSFNLLVNQKDWDGAINAATDAIEYNPKNSVAFVNRSWAYAEKGKYDEAIKDANIALEMSPRNAMAFNNRAYAYELAGSRTRAIQDYRISCELRYKPACKTVIKLEQTASNGKDSTVNELLDRSYEKFQQKDWVAVEDISTRTLKLDPGNEIAYVNRAGARAELGLFSPALADCYRAMEINPDQGLAHNNCAYTYERMGQTDLAIHSYKEACDLGIKQSCQDYTRMSSLQQ